MASTYRQVAQWQTYAQCYRSACLIRTPERGNQPCEDSGKLTSVTAMQVAVVHGEHKKGSVHKKGLASMLAKFVSQKHFIFQVLQFVHLLCRGVSQKARVVGIWEPAWWWCTSWVHIRIPGEGADMLGDERVGRDRLRDRNARSALHLVSAITARVHVKKPLAAVCHKCVRLQLNGVSTFIVLNIFECHILHSKCQTNGWKWLPWLCQRQVPFGDDSSAWATSKLQRALACSTFQLTHPSSLIQALQKFSVHSNDKRCFLPKSTAGAPGELTLAFPLNLADEKNHTNRSQGIPQ